VSGRKEIKGEREEKQTKDRIRVGVKGGGVDFR